MKELLKKIIEYEVLIESLAKDCNKEYKSFYLGFVKGIKEIRELVIKTIFNI